MLTNCNYCNKLFNKKKCHINRSKNNFCNRNCYNQYKLNLKIETYCALCNKQLYRTPHEIKCSKSGNQFCCKSHAAFYNNKRRKKSRRSKIEIKFFNTLQNMFPNIKMLPNDKTMLDGYEVDVAIPELRLAIEWNGMVHFKPIYGEEKLSKVQQRDKEKLKIASNNNINLIVITDLVSNDERLNEALNQVSDIINQLI